MALQGIIYKSIPYKETSNLVYLYTNVGHITVKALKSQNPKDKNFGFHNVGNVVSFVAEGNRDIKNLIEYSVLLSNYKLIESIDKIKSLSVMIELIEYIPKDSNHNKIYDFIFDMINNIDNNPLKALSIFLIKMTYAFGINPNLNECVICKRKDNLVNFDINHGGALCSNCSKNKIELYQIIKEYYYKKDNFDNYNNYEFKELIKIFLDYYLINSNIKLKF